MKRILLALLLVASLAGCATIRPGDVFDMSKQEYWPGNYRITLYDEGKEVDHWLVKDSDVLFTPEVVTFNYRGRTIRLHGAVTVREVGDL